MGFLCYSIASRHSRYTRPSVGVIESAEYAPLMEGQQQCHSFLPQRQVQLEIGKEPNHAHFKIVTTRIQTVLTPSTLQTNYKPPFLVIPAAKTHNSVAGSPDSPAMQP
jgi:hypothetical protein